MSAGRELFREQHRDTGRNGPLIEVLKRGLWREEEKISNARAEIVNIKMQLLELGVEVHDEASS